MAFQDSDSRPRKPRLLCGRRCWLFVTARSGLTHENELIERTLAGDSHAFGTLVRQYQDRLYTSMVHVVGNPEDARDIVQDAFVRALTRLSTFQKGSSFYTWLYRIAFNLAMNRHQRLARERRALVGRPPRDPDAPADAIERQERVALVHQALNSLDERFRAVLVLRELEQLDYDSIAEILNIQVGTVRSRLHRARLMLRDALQRLKAGEG